MWAVFFLTNYGKCPVIALQVIYTLTESRVHNRVQIRGRNISRAVWHNMWFWAAGGYLRGEDAMIRSKRIQNAGKEKKLLCPMRIKMFGPFIKQIN